MLAMGLPEQRIEHRIGAVRGERYLVIRDR
jgi:hypothetical protein